MTNNKISLITLVVLSCIGLFACKKSGSNPTPPLLAINSLSVNTGPYNTTVEITGTGFSSTATADQVTFNGKAALITASTATKLTAVVPKGAGTGAVMVNVNNLTVSGPVFTYLLTATVSTFAGNNDRKSVDGNGTAASFSDPYALATDRSGNVYVADEADNVIRKITPVGVVTTLAGSGKAGSSNGIGAAASFRSPSGLVADASGNVYVSDPGNFQIRKITPEGNVTTIAGSGVLGRDDGTGTAASFYDPGAMAIDASGNLFVLDQSIRKITPAGVVTTIAGTAGSDVYTGIVVDAAGNFYLSGGQSYIITKITAGLKTTFAGTGKKGADNGTGTDASFSFLTGIAIDNSGNIIVADNSNSQIRMVSPAAKVSTLAGVLNSSFPTVDGTGNVASFYSLSGVAVDPSGIIYVAEANNHRIRKIILE